MYPISSWKNCNARLYVSCIIASSSPLLAGYCLAWTWVAIPRLDGRLQPERNPLKEPILANHKVWIVSLIPIGGVIGSLLSGYLAEKRGRKQVLVLANLFLWMGLGVIYFSMYIYHLLIGRFVCGVGIGGALTIVPLYLGEIAESNSQWPLSMFTGVFIILGTSIAHSCSLFMTLNEINLTFFVVAFIFTLFVDWFIPESYVWLFFQDRSLEAENCFRQIRKFSNTDNLTNELIITKRYVTDSYRSKLYLLDMFIDKTLLKKLLVICGLMFFQQIIGVGMLLIYTTSILNHLEYLDDIQPNQLLAILVSIIQLLSSTLAMIFVNIVGKKILLLVSTIGNGIYLITLGTYFAYQEVLPHIETAGILFFAATYALGLGPIPFVILGEIFPLQIKFVGAPIAICFALICTVCVGSIVALLLNIVTKAVLFWIIAVKCVLCGLWVHFYIPEAKDTQII